ncbi:MAG TPA: SRPBCC family protein [Rhizomicrobium sp.]|jgi:uncharacterized protein YndB with AHSA1/START domain
MVAFVFAVVVIAGLAGYIASRPNSFRMERSIVIAAPPEKIFPLIANFHEWTKWSPFEKLDTDLKRGYSGPDSGVGAIYTWDGKKAGAGRMEILEAPPSSLVRIKLDFSKPFTAHNIAEFTIVPQGEGTSTVTWAMSGPQPFVVKAMSTVMSTDKIVGPQFEEGLASMKRAAES